MPLHPKAKEFVKSGLFAGVKSFADLEKRIAAIPENKGKGDAFEELVKAFLLLDPEYATKISEVWIHHEVPSAIRKKLHLPDSDQGIDLIAKTKDGEFWAIQCKYRAESSRPIPWREISTFTGLAFGVCKGISFGLICSTTERITNVVGKQDRIGFCALDVWQGLDAEFFDRLRALVEHKTAKIKPLSPRPHQVAAVRDARKHYVTGKKKRGKLIMPCGTGKSLTAYWIAKELGSRRIVIAVPSLALIRQTLKVWLREAMASGKEVEWICVCSDETAGRFGSDDVSVLRQDLGIPCLTDPKEIAGWLKKKSKGLHVVFTTYQSGQALSAAARKAKFRFDLGIMDEAHKTVGDGEKLFSHLLHDRNLPVDRRVFMTATERRYQGRGEKILSMEDPTIYGETFHLLSFKAALEQKPPILCDYRIVTIMVSHEEVSEMVRKNAFVRPKKGQWDREVESEMLASLVALRKAMKKHPIRHAVSFHESIRKAEHFAEQNLAFNKAFTSFGHVDSFHVSGATATGTRSKLIKEFAESKQALITNARCLTEGVDVPDIDCVLFADPRRSAVDIVQAVGRALRPSPGKKMGYVIVPILHDEKAKPEKILESEDFKEILSTLRALASNDDRIIEYFRAIANGKKRPSGGSVTFDIDERIAKKIDLDQFIKDIDLKCWHRLAKLSWRPFEEAREFVRGLGLSSFQKWVDYTQGKIPMLGILPKDIPAYPIKVYNKKGWISYGDWLGNGYIANQLRNYRSYEDARIFVHSLGLTSGSEWIAYTRGEFPNKERLPKDIPATPEGVYKNIGWVSWGDFLGTYKVADQLRIYRPFENAREFAQSLALSKGSEWKSFCLGKLSHKGKLPIDIPRSPNIVYKDKGWLGMGDWLGTGNLSSTQLNQNFLRFEEARQFVRRLKLKNIHEWNAYCKGAIPEKGERLRNIPTNPNQVYAEFGWAGVGDWLGTFVIAQAKKTFRNFNDARDFARSLNLKTQSEWNEYCRGNFPDKGLRPRDIPRSPSRTYAGKGWISMGDWLGTGAIAPQLVKYRSFQSARKFAHGLGLKNHYEWRAFCKDGKVGNKILPSDIPASPFRVYKNNGWKGFGDWLGTGNLSNMNRTYRSFEEARKYVHSLSLKNQSEWVAFCRGKLTNSKLPLDIPSKPDRVYAGKGWLGMSDWLGNGRKPRIDSPKHIMV
jgi:superfamily II DNA or RNA helicase